jgi:hypothetical protein
MNYEEGKPFKFGEVDGTKIIINRRDGRKTPAILKSSSHYLLAKPEGGGKQITYWNVHMLDPHDEGGMRYNNPAIPFGATCGCPALDYDLKKGRVEIVKENLFESVIREAADYDDLYDRFVSPETSDDERDEIADELYERIGDEAWDIIPQWNDDINMSSLSDPDAWGWNPDDEEEEESGVVEGQWFDAKKNKWNVPGADDYEPMPRSRF